MTDSTATPAATAPEAPRLERCPTCNAKLPDTPVSLCPYCATPLPAEVAPAAGGTDSPNAGRIERVRAHEDFDAAMGWSPPEAMQHQLGRRRVFHGRTAIVAGSVAVGFAVGLAGSAFLGHPLTWLGILGLAGGAAAIVHGLRAQRAALTAPLLKRPGIVLDRRSETELRGWGGRTTYYFTVELEGGVVGEFRYPGRGASEDPYVTNLPGVAYTRGSELLSFRHVRV